MKNRAKFKVDKIFFLIRSLFYVINLLFIAFYLYPGSILGWIIYKNSRKQPELTKYIFEISPLHIYSFISISLLCLFAYREKKYFKKVLFYLFFLAIFLEIMHLIIPYRGFELNDLAGNLLGIIISLVIFLIYKIWVK